MVETDCRYSLPLFFPLLTFSLSCPFLRIQEHVSNKSLPGTGGWLLQKTDLFILPDRLLFRDGRVVHRNRPQTANNAPLVGLATNSFGLQEIVVGGRDHAWNHKAYT